MVYQGFPSVLSTVNVAVPEKSIWTCFTTGVEQEVWTVSVGSEGPCFGVVIGYHPLRGGLSEYAWNAKKQR